MDVTKCKSDFFIVRTENVIWQALGRGMFSVARIELGFSFQTQSDQGQLAANRTPPPPFIERRSELFLYKFQEQMILIEN